MDKRVDDDLTAEHEALLKRMGFGRLISRDEEAGRAVIEFTAAPDMCHSGGIVQGGFVTGWIDNAMANAAIAHAGGERSMTTLELKMSFLRPARAGATVRAEGWVVRAGRNVMFMEGELKDEDGVLIARASATGQWLPMPGG